MEPCHGRGTDKTWTEHIHLLVEAVVHNEVMCHADTMGFHGMALAVVIIAHLGIVEVGHATVACGGGGGEGAGGGGHCRHDNGLRYIKGVEKEFV